MQVSSIKEDWIRLTVRVWIRQIPRKDAIISEYLDSIIESLKAEDLLDKKVPEGEPAPEPLACPIPNIQKEVET